MILSRVAWIHSQQLVGFTVHIAFRSVARLHWARRPLGRTYDHL